MVYKNKLIAAIQVGGKTLREKGDTVELPFKSEYSIFLKNLETRRCKIDINIDGTNVTEGGLVINGLASVNLERFLDDNRKFKFIAKSRAIEEFRGNKPEDGIIEIKYGFEKRVEIVDVFPVVHHYYHPHRWGQPYYPPYRPGDITYGSSVNGNTKSADSSNFTGNVATAGIADIQCSTKSINRSLNINSVSASLDAAPIDDSGITVKGSESNQEFTTVSSFDIGKEETIIFRLVGGSNKIVTTKTKKQCPSCGTKVKSKHEYCPSCGTYVS